MIDMRVRLTNEFRQVTKDEMKDFYGKYSEVMNLGDFNKLTIEHLIHELNRNNIDLAVVHAEYEFGEDADLLNKHVGELVKKYSKQLMGFGTVNLNDLQPMKLVNQVQQIHALGLKGINLQPVFFNVNPLDAKLYPLYAAASQYELILSFHTGIHYSLKTPFVNNNPLFIDQIAVDFPNLSIIANHGGWPWTPEMTAVARRHSNVFIEFGGMDPKYIGVPGAGWETLITLMDNLLSNQILFGTDWPVMNHQRVINGWNKLGLKEEVIEKLFHKNAERLLIT